MLALDKFAAGVAWPLALTLSFLVAALVAFVFVRRGYRYLYFRRLDEVRARCGPVLEGMLAGSTRYEDGFRHLSSFAQGRSRDCLEALLMADKNPPPERAAILARLCENLGLATQWRCRLAERTSEHHARPGRIPRCQRGLLRRLRPLSFVLRAEAAENLGIIRHRPSWPLLVEAVGDPHPSVRSAAAQALGRIQEPRSFPALAERLKSTAIERAPEISLRSLKMALISFPAALAAHLRPLLESPHPRVRFLASDVVSGLVQRQGEDRSGGNPEKDRLPPGIAEIFLSRLWLDGNPDVRARAADVLGHLEDKRAAQALLQLAEDPQWFVRLHAVRALAHHRLVPFAILTRRLTDPHWRVREAAARAMCAQGDPGVDGLVEHFLSTEDRYSQEQVTEQLGRAGLISSNFLEVLAALERESAAAPRAGAGPEGERGTAAMALRNGIQSRKRERLLQEFARHSGHEIESFARHWVGASGVAPGGGSPSPAR
jgi:HEAT repeat protein